MALHVFLKSSEVKLAEALSEISATTGWHAAHFHLNGLLEQYQSEYQIKIAVNLIYDLLKNFEGGVYVLHDRSIMVLCYKVEKTLLNKLIFQLRYLYMDDPLAYGESGQENPAFCTLSDLREDWRKVMTLANQYLAAATRGKPAAVREAPEASKTTVLWPEHIEEDVRQADLAAALRRQPVCAILANRPLRKVFDELYIHIVTLRKILRFEMDFFSNRWLFKYMTYLLDDRMIEMIRVNPARFLNTPVSLNLNVETLLSSRFLEFDAMIQPALKASIVLELPVIDVFADMAGFTYARQEAQRMGYRVCLDGLTTHSFINIEREKFGLDLIKVQWNAETDLSTRENRDLAVAVMNTGNNRVILCRCDNKQAVEFGQGLGVSLFQGRYIDSLFDPSGKADN